MDHNRETIDRYNRRLIKYGYNPKTLGWIKGRQGIRFSTLVSIGNINNSSVLDIGCGFGDLYGFLKYKKLRFSYLGLELNPNLIEYGTEQYPKADFRVFDIVKDDIDKKYDWVIISGLFNFKRKLPYQFIEFVLRKAFNCCRRGVAADFMTTYVDFKNKDANYVNPEKIMKVCKQITTRITLRQDYMPYEFCIYLYKNNIKTRNGVYSEHYLSLDPEIRTNKWLSMKSG